MIEGPGVFLCFDDQHIDEWYEWINFFDDKRMEVTFYLTNLKDIDNSQWSRVHQFQEHGHTIACHGLDHLCADSTVKELGCQGYLEKEIYPCFSIFKNHGIHDVKHFAYPRGNHTPKSDSCLFDIFDTLRIGGCRIYARHEILKVRLIGSADFGKNVDVKYSGHEGRLEEIVKGKSFVNFHMHNPIKHRLKYLADYGRNKGIKFHSMKELNR